MSMCVLRRQQRRYQYRGQSTEKRENGKREDFVSYVEYLCGEREDLDVNMRSRVLWVCADSV